MGKVLAIIFWGLILTTCSPRWRAMPQDVSDFERCKPLSDNPQMLKIPQFDNAYMIVHSCDSMDRQRVSIAMHTFLEKWKVQFPRDHTGAALIKETLETLLVEFNGDDKTTNAYAVDGNYYEKVSVSGLTISKGWVWVKVRPEERLCKTSFIHELIHVAIWTKKGTDGDPDHLGGLYSGWKMEHNLIIQETNKALCEWGI